MPNESRTTPFPASQQDVSDLKQTATDAASDLGSTAMVHASKAKGQLKSLASHVQEEGNQQFDQVKGKFTDLIEQAGNYAAQRPFTCMGAALALGFLFGLSRRSSKD